jgi:hypothetical protein
MPYIAKNLRRSYDPLIDKLATKLLGTATNDNMSGDFNYIIFRLAKILLDPTNGGQKRYARMNMISGVLTNVELEIYRRLIAPYEDEKIGSEGDIET